jgi:hypothetical protein
MVHDDDDTTSGLLLRFGGCLFIGIIVALMMTDGATDGTAGAFRRDAELNEKSVCIEKRIAVMNKRLTGK